MDDFRVMIGFLDHYKTDDLRDFCGGRDTGDHAVVCFLRLWEFCTKQPSRRDGNLIGMSDRQIEKVAKWSRDKGVFVQALLESEYLDGDEGQRVIHDWEDHQPYVFSFKARSDAARLAARARWSKKNKPNKINNHKCEEHADSMRSVCDSHAGSMHDACGAYAPTPIPTPIPNPNPDPNPDPKPNPKPFLAPVPNGTSAEDNGSAGIASKNEITEDARSVVDFYLQEFPGSRIKVGAGAGKRSAWAKVKARLREGFTADELQTAILGNKHDEWYAERCKHQLDYICQSETRVNELIGKRKAQLRDPANRAENNKKIGPGHRNFIPKTPEEHKAHRAAMNAEVERDG